jgi:hypothetical protein
VDHEREDAHLGGAAVVELDGGLLVEGSLVPTGCLELGGLEVVLAGSVAELDGADESDQLSDTGGGDCVEGCEASLILVEKDRIK